jgi:predicted outer membrane repeat protein
MEDHSMTSTFVRTSCLASAIAIALAAVGLRAATLTVDSPDDDPASTACTLRDALTAINEGSTVSVPTCSAAVSGDAFGTNDTVAFDPFAGISTVYLTQGALAITASSVTISGTDQWIDAQGNSPVLAVGDGAILAANRVVLTGGKSETNGAGVSLGIGATAVFTSCSLQDNWSTGDGGAVYAAAASVLTLVNSTITGNSAHAGGGLFTSGSTVTVTNSQFDNNGAYSGGAIYASSGTLALDTANIIDNTAQDDGAGVVVVGGALTMANSIVFANTGGRSGGIYLSQATGTVSTTTLNGNTPKCRSSCAGAIFLSGSTLAVSDSTISGNLAAGRANSAGGAYLFDSTATFANSTISGNVGVGGDRAAGAFWEAHFGFGKGLTLINSTVSNNSAAALYGTAAGAVMLGPLFFSPPPADAGNTLILKNSIVSANSPADTEIVFNEYSFLEAEYSLLGSAQNISVFNDPGSHNIFSDSPGLGPLQDNGGPVKTQALLPDSPALRAGKIGLAVFAGQFLNFDQRGPNYVRTYGGTIDIGAFEDQGDRLFASGFESTP